MLHICYTPTKTGALQLSHELSSSLVQLWIEHPQAKRYRIDNAVFIETQMNEKSAKGELSYVG